MQTSLLNCRSMYKDTVSRKLIDIMGNIKLDINQKSWCLLKEIDTLDADKHSAAMLTVCECYGLVPRHETDIESCEISENDIENYTNKHKSKLEHNLKGWFEINKDQPRENTISEICYYFQNILDFNEKAVVFSNFLSSKYIPISVNFFSKHMDEKNDNYILREYASEFIQMRQLLNLNVGPTSRGSLLLDFLKPLQDYPDKQAILLGAFIEELLRRLKNKPKEKVQNQINMPFNIGGLDMGGDPDQLREMMKKMQSILPPEVIDQLKNLFSDLDNDENSENDSL